MKRYYTLDQLLDVLAVSRTRYYAMRDPKSEWYEMDLPKPRNPYGDTKLRFYSGDVDRYIESTVNRAA